jgi:hypothetical protein
MAFSVRALTASCLCFRPNESEEARDEGECHEGNGLPEHEFDEIHARIVPFTGPVSNGGKCLMQQESFR